MQTCLACVIWYLRLTINMPLTLEADSLQLTKWWVDASFAVHMDMKSHTGGALSLGKGVIFGTSTCQKINTRSSTEAQLVDINEVLPQVLCTCHFLEAPGNDTIDSIVYQDNQSAVLLEKNGHASSIKCTCHLNILYFFVADWIDAGELEVQYCPKAAMIADFFTKPLQGTLFKEFQDLIINIAPGSQRSLEHSSVLEHKYTSTPCTNSESSGTEPSTQCTNNEWTLVARKNTMCERKPLLSALTLK